MVKHKVVIEGKSTLVIEEDPSWAIPTAHFSILFDTDPADVLMYGPNGLHFSEHIIWNILNSHYQFDNTNATTYGTGEMSMYGTCPEDDLTTGIKSFYGGLDDMLAKKISREVYKTEQRRVSAETSMALEQSKSKGATNRMFTYNTDLLRSEYPREYVWNILLRKCKLQHIVIMVHCKISGEEVKLFKALAAKFEKGWKGRSKSKIKDVPLPMLYCPAMSHINGKKERSETVDISLSTIENPIERAIIAESLSVDWCEYYLKISIFRRNTKRPVKKAPEYALDYIDYDDQYFASSIIASAGGDMKVEWIDDLHNLTSRKLLKKYGRGADKELSRLLGSYSDV